MRKSIRKPKGGLYSTSVKTIGFTLVELLAVIVVLAVILIIAIPRITHTIEGAKLGSIESTVKSIADSAEREYVERNTMGTLDQEEDPIECGDVAKLSSSDYENCSISFSNGTAYVTIDGKGKLEKYSCTNGSKANPNCNREIDVYEEAVLNGAYPRVTSGMIPVTIANNGVVTTVDPKSSTWYNYATRNWANVVLVKENGTNSRAYYETHTDVSIPESDILAYLVWIPRYRYTLWNVNGNAATYTGGCSNISWGSPLLCVNQGCTWTEPVCTNNCPQSINIIFEDASTTKSNGTTNGTQLTHPAFTYNGVELNGIWAGKFETAPLEGTTCANDQNEANCLDVSPIIKPNVKSLIYQKVSTQFTTSLKLETYGLTGESRMSKNVDWGAILYLSHSAYGINTDIRLNNNNGFKTGCGASLPYGDQTLNCEIAYGGSSSYPQSTTGNISGIFDISGGSYEYQMGVLGDPTGNPRSGNTTTSNSGFNGMLSDGTIYNQGLNFPDSKYYKIYNSTNWHNNINYLGEALGETRGWYEARYWFVNTNYTWSIRGGSYYDGVVAGEGFYISYDSGRAFGNISFRTIAITS